MRDDEKRFREAVKYSGCESEAREAAVSAGIKSHSLPMFLRRWCEESERTQKIAPGAVPQKFKEPRVVTKSKKRKAQEKEESKDGDIQRQKWSGVDGLD